MKNNAHVGFLNRMAILSLIWAIVFSPCLNAKASEIQSITITSNDSISIICFKMYEEFSPEMLEQFSKINPHVRDWNNLAAGQKIQVLSKKEMYRRIPKQKRETVIITFLKHPVLITRDTQVTHEKAQLNMILDDKDLVEVKGGGRVELMMSRGRIIRLEEDTSLRIGTLKREEEKQSVTGKFKLFLGRLWGKVVRARGYRKKEMYVSTPTLVAGVRGTAYDLKLKPDQSSIIKVFEGEVEIYNPLQKMPESGIIKDFKKPHRVKGPHRVTEKEWNEILLRQYQQVIVTKEGISKPIHFDYEKERQTEWIKWNEERDLVLDKNY